MSNGYRRILLKGKLTITLSLDDHEMFLTDDEWKKLDSLQNDLFLSGLETEKILIESLQGELSSQVFGNWRLNISNLNLTPQNEEDD